MGILPWALTQDALCVVMMCPWQILVLPKSQAWLLFPMFRSADSWSLTMKTWKNWNAHPTTSFIREAVYRERVCKCAQLLQSGPTLCNSMDYSPPGSFAHGILQARILEWVAVPSSRGSSRPRDWTWVSCVSCIAGSFLTAESPGKPYREHSVQFSCSVMSDSLWPHGLQRVRLPCLSPTPRVCSHSCALSQWCHPTISSSVVPFSSCLQGQEGLFPASGSFPVSQFF